MELEDSSSVPPSSADEEWMFVDSSHPNKVLEGLNRLRLNTTLCDLILCCEGQEFPCHRFVLASFSPYFEAMFTSHMVESTHKRVTISGVEPQMMRLLVDYAYTSKVSITTANVQALLEASDLLDVAAVRQACCDYMMRHMDTSNCVAVYCSAETHSCKALERNSLGLILQHFSVIYKQEAFLSLSVERLVDILGRDDLLVPKEDMVFEAAMLWLAKCPTRKHNFEKVLEQVRLPFISPHYIHTVIQSLEEVVKENQACQKFISEARDQPYCKTARPRRTTVIMMMGTGELGSHDTVKCFHPLISQWSTVGDLPQKVSGHAVVMSGSFLYLAGGLVIQEDPLGIRSSTASVSREVWRYDVDHNSWLKMAPMNLPRIFLSLVMLDGQIFAVGGQGGNNSEDSLECYDPSTNTWQMTESVGVAAYADGDLDSYKAATVVALDGLLYFICGLQPCKTMQPPPHLAAKYNPETSVLTEVAPMRVRRNDLAACTLNGKIYVTGGNVAYPCRKVTCLMECYNPTTNQWTYCASMPGERYMHGAVEMDGNIYVLGGQDEKGRYPQNIIRYCEETDTWETVGKMAPGRYDKLICVSVKLRTNHASLVDLEEHAPVVEEDEGEDEEEINWWD